MQLQLRQDRALLRSAGGSVRYLVVSFTAPLAAGPRTRLPLDAAVVLDRSGSMGGPKIGLAREAAARALRRLAGDDRFTLVVYDDRVDVLAELGAASGARLAAAQSALELVGARGSTALHAGWMAGARPLADHADGRVRRCLLLTDGLANRGVSDVATLAAEAAALRRAGVVTSTFGVGHDFDEALLAKVAEAGGGAFYFLAEPARIPEFLEREMGDAAAVVARDAELVITAPPGVDVSCLEERTVVHAGGAVRVALGDVHEGEEVTAVLRLRFPAAADGDVARVLVGVRDAGGALQAEAQAATWHFAGHRANDGQPREVAVDRLVATAYAARARLEAVARNREGDLDGAMHVLRRTAERIEGYAGRDPELLELARALRRESAWLGEEVLPMADRKQLHMAAYAMREHKDADGFRRRPTRR
ncbi:MAG: VWA domain-containing protein [Gemmatimonadales bacterium]|nr:VWA domain-containing protein [Gemmatimonadales bacterium]